MSAPVRLWIMSQCVEALRDLEKATGRPLPLDVRESLAYQIARTLESGDLLP